MKKTETGAKKTKNGAEAEKIEVIRTKNTEGTGRPGDPVRTIVRYWELDGRLIAEEDPIAEFTPVVRNNPIVQR